MIARALLFLFVTQASAAADDLNQPLPTWVLPGIAMVESRSYYGEQGWLIYVDRRTGAAGEVGPFQMCAAALAQVERRWSLSYLRDPIRAELAAVAYLRWLRERTRSWQDAVAAYNVGLYGNREIGRVYCLRVMKAGGLL